MERFLATTLIFVIPGLFVILYTLRLLNGKGNKSFYMTNDIYSGRVYGAIPFGVAFLIFAIAAIPQSQNLSFFIISVGFGCVILGLVFAFTQPSFLKPTWLKWLEREHGEIMPLLRKEAQEMNLNVWNEQIQTQADLEEWVAEVRRKHGL